MTLKRYALASLLAVPLATMSAQPSSIANEQASERCAPRQQIIDILADQYQEKQQGVGMVNENAVFEIFISRAGTWTAIVSDVQGLSCVIGSGAEWEGMPILADDQIY
jgi:hypothetical protein